MISVDQVRRKIERDGIAGLVKAGIRRLGRKSSPPAEENILILGLFGSRTGTMVDVGACRGAALLPFAEKRWSVHAFEPDPANRAALLTATNGLSRIQISDRAVTETDDQVLTFYTSPESIGVSSLTPFTDKHQPSAEVHTTRLDTYLRSHDVQKVDYLKIDAEAHDYFALRSFPFDRIKPDAILCEFEDRKTEPLGYKMADMADFLVSHGYVVVVSEWFPIVRYGTEHQWRRFFRYPTETVAADGWGNLIAIRDPAMIAALPAVIAKKLGEQ